MKKLIITSILAVLAAAGTIVRAQDWHEEYLGLPGDNLNLYAVMNLFQESRTLEEFEAELNSKDSRINNLDLNGDNFIDYITVNDYVEGKIHTIVLRAVLGRNDFQDVAVFIVERKNRNKVRIQLIGDEMLYGRNYIIEPRGDRPNPGYRDNVVYVSNVYYYDLSWPMLDWMYMPGYVAWHSQWHWGYWPAWYEPWSPWYWHYYYGYHYNWYPYYHKHFHYWNHPAIHYYNDYYSHYRSHSLNVERRKTEGHYKKTYSRPDLVSQGEALYRAVDTRRSEDRAAAAAAGRSTPVQSSGSRTSTSVSTDRRNSAVINSRSSESRSSSPASVSRSSESRSSSAVPQRRSESEVRSTPAPQRSSASEVRSTPAPQRSSNAARVSSGESSSSRSSASEVRSTPAPQRSSNAARVSSGESSSSRSSASEVRSTPAPQRSSNAARVSSGESSSSRSSSPASVSRSSESRSSSPASVSRSSESRSSSADRTSSPQKSGSAVNETRSSSDRGTTNSSRR